MPRPRGADQSPRPSRSGRHWFARKHGRTAHGGDKATMHGPRRRQRRAPDSRRRANATVPGRAPGGRRAGREVTPAPGKETGGRPERAGRGVAAPFQSSHGRGRGRRRRAAAASGSPGWSTPRSPGSRIADMAVGGQRVDCRPHRYSATSDGRAAAPRSGWRRASWSQLGVQRRRAGPAPGPRRPGLGRCQPQLLSRGRSGRV